MQFPLIVSFYTENYHLHAQHLISSCKRFDLEAYVEAISSFGSWELNCAYKPFFILEKLKAFQRPLLWVDADAIIVQKPTMLPEFAADFAVRINDLPHDHPSKVMSGTIYVNATEEACRILRAWAKRCQEILIDPERKEEFWDQIALRDVLDLNMLTLPHAYTSIYSHPLEKSEPVIAHLQASRIWKKNTK